MTTDPSGTGGRTPGDDDLVRAVRGSGSRRPVVLAAAAVAALLVLGGALGFAGGGSSGKSTKRHEAATSPSTFPPVKQGASPVPIPKSAGALAAGYAALMGIVPRYGALAPTFSLLDQRGKRVTLGQFASRAVVLTFLSSSCQDLCPVVAREMRDADRDLGHVAARVALVAINVDAARSSVADVARSSRQQGVAGLANWYELTGSRTQLREVWSAYGIQVESGPGGGSVLYTPVMDFLSPGGAARYQATPYADESRSGAGSLPAATIARWGAGIAGYAEAALRAGP